ncbi:MAG: hypothetical protein EKK42_20200 [Pseudonocardiaceae bacterium]|nr:MAG: hypothetical protein EKK42_20200 [Pseudonocardiaceae bacterium]
MQLAMLDAPVGKSRGETEWSPFETLDTSVNPFDGDAVFVDWSERKGVDVLTNWGSEVRGYPTLSELLTSLPNPTTVVLESSWESYHLDRRAQVLELAAERGHRLLVVAPQQTKRTRKRVGSDHLKSNSLDVGAIRHFAMSEAARNSAPNFGMRPASALADPWIVGAADRFKRLFVDLRRTSVRRQGRITPKSKFADGSIFEAGGDRFYDALVDLVPSIDDLSPRFRDALRDRDQSKGNKYHATTLVTVALLSLVAENRREFDRLAGQHNYAHPSVARSQLIWHSGSRYRGKSATSRSEGYEPWTTRTDYKAACRHLFQICKPLRAEIERAYKEIVG